MKKSEPKPAVDDVVRFNGGKSWWRVQRIEQRRSGVMLVCYGPLESVNAQGGVPFWTGEKLTRIKIADGSTKAFKPHKVKVVKA